MRILVLRDCRELAERHRADSLEPADRGSPRETFVPGPPNFLADPLALELSQAGHSVALLSRTRQELHAQFVLAQGEIDADAFAPERLTLPADDAAREALRRILDRVIATFDPHVAYADQPGMLAHLVLEAGVPYVVCLTGQGAAPEARSTAAQRRFQVEAVENAGRVLAPDTAATLGCLEQLGDLDGRLLICPQPSAAELAAIFAAILADRFGGHTPRP